MNIRRLSLLAGILLGCHQPGGAQTSASGALHPLSGTQEPVPVEVTLHPDRVENRIDRRVYGFLLEHLYHSVSNGLWGENVWNRSFEETTACGDWTVSHTGEVTLNALHLPLADFRICRGNNLEIHLKVKRLEGDGPILIGMRDQNRDRMLTNRVYWFLGDRNNTCHRLELSTGWVWHTPVVKTVDADLSSGSIDLGEWVDVRMRCDGTHLQGWLDGKPVFNHVVDNCPINGAVTLGGSDCRVAFRDIRIQSTDNPKPVVNLNPTRHWSLVGEGTVRALHARQDTVLNQDVALHLHSTGKGIGVDQPRNYSARRHDLLSGSLYLRGSVSTAYVRLMDGGKVLSEQRISGISASWKEFPVSLPAQKDIPWATLRIFTPEKGDLYIDQVSLMHQSSIDNGGFRVELTKAAGDLRPTLIRWPGGSFSEQYRFEDGLGPQSTRKGILRWDDFDPLSFGTDEFIAFCRKIGAEPQIVVPIGYMNNAGYVPDLKGYQDWLQRALDWMEYCNGDAKTTRWGKRRAENGHPEPYNVKYWEIDNETWKMNPEMYAEIARLFSIEMRKKCPGVKIIGCGCGRLGREGVGLDSIMIHRVAEYIDYISPHYYQTLDQYGNDGVEEYGRYLDKLSAWIAKSKNPDMKIFVSEWNLDGVDMRTGLFAGGFLNRMERTPRLEMAAPALFLRHTSATGWNNAFINFHQNGWFPAPNYVVFKLWRDNYLPNRIALTGDAKPLNLIATRSDDGRTVCLKIVNPTPTPFSLKVKGGNSGGTPEWEVVSAPTLTDSNSMEHPDAIRAKRHEVATHGQDLVLDVPAYSASVLRINNNN